MTVAVCYKCGEFKFGAFTPCEHCGALPATEDDLALSLMMTDHYFDRKTLDAMSTEVKNGKPLRLAPETRETLVRQIREFPGLLRFNKAARKPWWKFW